MTKWEEYEWRKQKIAQEAISSLDYEQRIRKLSEELGL